jgi:transposase
LFISRLICYSSSIVSASSQPSPAPVSAAFVEEVIRQLEAQLGNKNKQLEYAKLKIEALEQRLRQILIKKYGAASEKLSSAQLELLELEPGVSSEEVQAESEREVVAAPPATPEAQANTPSANRQKHPGRQSLPAHLARVEKVVACTPQQSQCGGCGEQTLVIGYEVSEHLDVEPLKYFVQVIKREKRACKQCQEQGVATAPVAERIIEKSLVSDQIVIDTIVRKYCDSLPLYRQSVMLKRDTDLEISRSTMDGWVMQVGELLLPIVRVMSRELLSGSYIQADETPVDVQTQDGSGKNHQGYLWQYGTPGGGVVFDFRMGREREGPKRFLGQFEGVLQTDGYAGYDHIGGPKMVHAACLAHARRKFIDAVKLNPKDQASIRIVKLMDELFAVDAMARSENMSPAQRHSLRLAKAPALLVAIRTQILAIQKNALPKSAAGKAAHYTLALWSKLTQFLQYPELELSNNLAENSMRPISIGRKNWMHIGSMQAGPKVAAILSVVESCRRLGLPIRSYLAFALPGLANRSIQSLQQMTPAAQAARI